MPKCKTRYCRNSVEKKGITCGTCKVRRYRKKHPIKSAYDNLKQNAKRRGKVFELSYEDFKTFAVKTEYYKKKGIYSDNYHVDRIDESKGYTIDNIQILTNSQNIKKFLNYKYDGERMQFETKVNKPVTVPDTPF